MTWIILIVMKFLVQLEEPKSQVFVGIGRTQDWITFAELEKTMTQKLLVELKEGTHDSISLVELEEPIVEDISTQL